MTVVWTLSSHHRKTYGRYGARPVASRCAVEVRSGPFQYSQCTRKRGHGPEEAFCKQHDPAAVKARDDTRKAKWARESAIAHNSRTLYNDAPVFLKALRNIAAGCDDPQKLARDVVGEHRAKLRPIPEETKA